MVLIVEDDEDIRELLAEMLQDHGYEVHQASNGAEALDELQKAEKPNVVLLDLMMPIMDGWEFRARMLRDPELVDIPVVVVSGAADLQESVRPLRAARVLTKPVKWPALLETVKACCA
jgi:CheY-like chemotaxis protein